MRFPDEMEPHAAVRSTYPPILTDIEAWQGNRKMSEFLIQELTQLLAQAESITFLTGAGMSTESGIPDFRSSSGIYARGAGEEVFSLERFHAEPTYFYTHARDLMVAISNAKPNAGHLAIASLEHHFGKQVDIVTQNIDTLHQEAGSTRVHPVHGTVETCSCTRCHYRISSDQIWQSVLDGDIPPRHPGCGGIFKPDITFFGEALPLEPLARSQRAIAGADLLVVAGTSLVVYPAAGLPSIRSFKSRLAVINRTKTHLDREAALVLRGRAAHVLSRAIDVL